MQGFYDIIENLIFSNLQKEYKGKEELGLFSTPFFNENDFYKEKYLQLYDEYGKYLGMVRHIRSDLPKRRTHLYLHKSKYILMETGHISHTGDLKFRLNANKIDVESLDFINNYLNGLRNYWKENFSKNLFHFIKVRPQLKTTVGYKKLFGYLHPINEN